MNTEIIVDDEGYEPHHNWEYLVTDGHVRAARLRRATPWLVTAAIVLIFGGLLAMTAIGDFESENSRDQTLMDVVIDKQNEARLALQGLPAPEGLSPEQVETAARWETLPTLHEQIRDGLNTSDEIPTSTSVTLVDEDVFWRTPWRPGQLVAARGSNVRIVGGIISTSREGNPEPMRWLAVFRKKDGVWSSATIDAEGFVSVDDIPQVNIADIPVTLDPVLDTGD